jgi:signal transduction histidine kinase/CheY-like chemotaxis protein
MRGNEKMNKNDQFVDSIKLLRKKAEIILEKKSHSLEIPVSDSDILKLIHELEVHQIELELQNEELKLSKAKEAVLAAEKYITLYDFAPAGYFTISREGEILELNLNGAKLLGKERSYLIKNKFSFFVSTESKPEFNHFLERVFCSKSKETCEITLTNPEKVTTFVLITGIVPEGRSQCMITVVDISEQKRSESIFKDVVEKNPMSIQILNMEGYAIQINSAHTRLFGVKPPSDYSVLKDPQLLSQGFGELFEKIKKGEVVFFPDSYFNVHDVDPSFPDSPVWVKAVGFSLNDINGLPERIVIMHENITERRQAEALLNDIIEKNPMSIQIVDIEGHIQHGNPAYYKLFGSAPPPDFSIFDDLQLKSKELEPLITLAKSGEVVNLPDIYFNPHDTVSEAPDIPLWIRALIFPLNDSSGKPKQFVLMHENITESKIAEQELIKAKEHAEESDRLKSAFLANMSHEIRTPMNGILGFAELLKEADLTNEQQSHYINIIEKSGARMLNIINDIIDISKIESGQMKVEVSETNVNELIENLYFFFKSECEGKGLQLHFRNALPVKESIINSDREKIYAILTNLIKNAVKFTKTGGIEFGYEKNEGYLRFFVKDTGMGIRPDQLEMVFERFRQGSVLLSRDYEGSGLGLSISKAYVEMLGGKIWVESKVRIPSERNDGGSTFYFTLPYSNLSVSNSPDVSAESSKIKPEKMRKLKVLIAEDDEGSEMYLTAILSLFSREILVTKTGVNAVEMCRKNPDLDLILMDIKMLDMDGYQATSLIREFNKDVVIVAQTAFAQNGTRELAIEAGCNDYLSKPIHRNELYKVLYQYFGK